MAFCFKKSICLATVHRTGPSSVEVVVCLLVVSTTWGGPVYAVCLLVTGTKSEKE